MKIYNMKNIFEIFYNENYPNCHAIAMYIVHIIILCKKIKAKKVIYLS